MVLHSTTSALWNADNLAADDMRTLAIIPWYLTPELTGAGRSTLRAQKTFTFRLVPRSEY